MSSFVTRNKPVWDELEQLTRQARKSIRGMTPEQLSRLDVLYRRTAIHLAQVSTRTHNRKLIHYLNDLTAGAHAVIYLPPKRSMFAGIVEFVVEGFARSVVRNGKFHALSAALLIGGAVLAYFAAQSDPMAAYALWPRGDSRQPGSTHEQLLDVLRGGRDQDKGTKFFFASFLFSHNLRVGLLAMALGVLAAIPTTLLMIYNGMILGVFIAIHHQAGIDAELWAWILPHGVTEMGAIVLCGGIGLMLGNAVIAPGLMTRTESLRQAGYQGGITALGVAGMLLFAAIIESFLRQSHLSTTWRLLFAAGTAVFWLAFFLHGYYRERAATAKANFADATE